jgi:hypothetical protein
MAGLGAGTTLGARMGAAVVVAGATCTEAVLAGGAAGARAAVLMAAGFTGALFVGSGLAISILAALVFGFLVLLIGSKTTLSWGLFKKFSKHDVLSNARTGRREVQENSHSPETRYL